jgi:hypothetical protein
MNPETEDALDELMSLFPITAESDAFFEAVSKLAVLADPDAIPAILDLADESSELSHALMESLEVYEPEAFVPRFLAALPGFARRNPELAKSAVSKMVWSSFELISQMAPTLPTQVKRALRSVLLEASVSEKQREQLLALL